MNSYSPTHDDVGVRPAKRRKRSPSDSVHEHSASSIHRQIILEEVDLEIGLRERLSETIQSRLTWALILQETFSRELRSQAGGSSELHSAALDALDAIEVPCDIIWDREPRFLAQLPTTLEPQPVSSVPIHADSRPASAYTPRPSTIRTRGLPRAPLQPAKKLLFLRNTDTDPPEVVKLACPDCSRSDFSNLQGLLNHCRIRHNREYGSHDECIRSCAVLVPDEERDWVVASGIELPGVSLPSLRRLFELAVGAGASSFISNTQEIPRAQEQIREPDTEPTEVAKDELERTGTPITKSLGYHEDTPALAPFLGRAPKKRVIHVHGNEDDVIDIFGNDGSLTDKKVQKRWHMRHAHRNIARPALEIPETAFAAEEVSNFSTETPSNSGVGTSDVQHGRSPTAVGLTGVGVAGTRFHITARITIADSSRWIPPTRRPKLQAQCTHQWRLVVSSPSYSLHITSILRKLTITCVTDPPPSAFTQPITLDGPPFIATSSTDKPFLAKLSFEWAGDANPPMDVEHWVELDPIHTGYPVTGEEQLLDVELDRNTELLPVRDIDKPVTWDAHLISDEVHDAPVPSQQNDSAEPDYVVALKTLLPQFPMTLKDVKGRMLSHPPYTLVSNSSHFRKLVEGRRKAIEVGRARALRDAYAQYVASHPEKGACVPLSTADVYHWLEDEGHLPRAPGTTMAATARTKQRMQETDLGPAGSEVFCRRCGLHRQYHPNMVKSEPFDSGAASETAWTQPVSLGISANTFACTSFSVEDVMLPLVDASRLTLQRPSTAGHDPPYGLSPAIFAAPRLSPTAVQYSSRSLVESADPRVMTAIRSLLSSTGLVRRSDGIASFIDGQISELAQLPKSVTEDALAPFALLALLTRCLVRLLVRGGLDAALGDEDGVRGQVRSRRKGNEAGQIRRVLSPSHVLRGLALGAQRRLADSAGLLLLARLGLPRARDTTRDRDPAPRADENVEGKHAGRASVGDSSLVAVKTEEEDDSERLFTSA